MPVTPEEIAKKWCDVVDAVNERHEATGFILKRIEHVGLYGDALVIWFDSGPMMQWFNSNAKRVELVRGGIEKFFGKKFVPNFLDCFFHFNSICGLPTPTAGLSSL